MGKTERYCCDYFVWKNAVLLVGLAVFFEFLYYCVLYIYVDPQDLFSAILCILILLWYIPFSCRRQYLSYRKQLYVAFVVFSSLMWILQAYKTITHVAIYYWVTVLDASEELIR